MLSNNFIKKSITIAASVAIFLCACQQNKKQNNVEDKSDMPAYAGKKEVTISGSITNAGNEWLTLIVFDNGAQIAMDSVKLSDDGTFKFILKPTNIDFYRFKVGSKGFLNLLLDSANDVELSANAAILDNYTIKGGKHTELFAILDKKLKAS